MLTHGRYWPWKTVSSHLNVPSSNEGFIFHWHLFTDNQWQEAVFENCIKSGDKMLTAEKGNLLADYYGNAVSNFFKLIFMVKQIVLLFSGINVQWPTVVFSQVFEKANCKCYVKRFKLLTWLEYNWEALLVNSRTLTSFSWGNTCLQ